MLGGMVLAAAAPACAIAPTTLPREPAAWLTYESRLRARLRDAGGGDFLPDLARKLLALTNRERAGLQPLAWSDELALLANAHAADLVSKGRVDHRDPMGF